MNQGKYIFAQLTEFLPRRVFERLVGKYKGNKKVKSFTSLESDVVYGLWTTNSKR